MLVLVWNIKLPHDSGAAVIAQHDGGVTLMLIKLKFVVNGSLDVYTIQKFRRSNSGTTYNQRTLVGLAILLKKRWLSLTIPIYGR